MRRLTWSVLGLGALFFVAAAGAFAQDAETVRVIHRFDWRRSIDQKYQGLVYGSLTGAWKLTAAPNGGTDVEARYELASESRRDNALTEKAVQAERVSRFRITPQGVMTGFTGDGVPYYRNFPAPLPADAGAGSVWTGNGELVGDFLGTGTATRIPILIEYRWVGPGKYGAIDVIQVKTKYALRYQKDQDATGDPTLTRAQGVRDATVSYDAVTHRVVFINERTQEQFTSAKGTTVANDGFVLTFVEGVPALGTAAVVAAFNQSLGRPPVAATELDAPAPQARAPSDLPDVDVAADPRGVKLTLQNLQFVADRAELLPGEDQRLATIAGLLKTVPGRNILVIGHTAAVGSVESQDSLSLDRAKSIVDKLKAAGLPAARFLYEGRGGRDPVATNDTEAGRAQNRRVEIIILDQ